MLKKVLSTVAAGALVATPVMAQATTIDRAPAPIEESVEGLEGEGSGIFLAVFAAAAIIAGLIIAAGGGENDDDLPTSP